MHDTVLCIIRSIDVHKACGPDGLSARILSECTDELAVPLTKLFVLSLSQGKFPTIWKKAHVAPVNKKGDRKDPANYRPVSLLSICSKVLERVVCDQLVAHVTPVLSPAQHGFLAGRSCETNLTCLVNQVWDAIAAGHQPDVIYAGYSSAFTSVNHSLLLHKLHHSYHPCLGLPCGGLSRTSVGESSGLCSMERRRTGPVLCPACRKAAYVARCCLFYSATMYHLA